MTTAELVANNTEKTVDRGSLYDEHEATDLRTRWQSIQGSFVDDPQQSVEQADELVATAIQRLAEIFAQEKSRLQGLWHSGSEPSTEDMRQALRRYRSFFDRILAV
jgi:hypothetical protein